MVMESKENEAIRLEALKNMSEYFRAEAEEIKPIIGLMLMVGLRSEAGHISIAVDLLYRAADMLEARNHAKN